MPKRFLSVDNIARETYLCGCLICCVVDTIFHAVKCRKFPLSILESKRTFSRAPSAGFLLVIKIHSCQNNAGTNDVNNLGRKLISRSIRGDPCL